MAVAGPFGAVKEQCAGLYAEELAARGFAALAFDPSFIGESGGEVRNVASPDINTEDFSAAVDFLSTRDFIDPEQIGILASAAGAAWPSTPPPWTPASSHRHLHHVRHDPGERQGVL